MSPDLLTPSESTCALAGEVLIVASTAPSGGPGVPVAGGRCLATPLLQVNNSFILESTFWKEQDQRKVTTHTLISTDVLNKGALPYSSWTNDRKYSQL
ncbi:hypothetical protein ZWY2020_046310 [Hordeum vulgare]|nr:hypothetical protein ZWY2020_046310 [Hordeum vulgare]